MICNEEEYKEYVEQCRKKEAEYEKQRMKDINKILRWAKWKKFFLRGL